MLSIFFELFFLLGKSRLESTTVCVVGKVEAPDGLAVLAILTLRSYTRHFMQL